MNTHLRSVTRFALVGLVVSAAGFTSDMYERGGGQAMASGPDTARIDVFRQADTDGNGILSRSEFQAWQQAKEERGYRAFPYVDPNFAAKRVGDLVGMTVVNRQGNPIGRVDQVLQRALDDKVYAVVGVGEYLGIGDTQVKMPLDRMILQDNRLIAPTAATAMEITARPFHQSVFRVLDDQVYVGSVGGTSALRGEEGGLSFAALDQDGNGYISLVEASRSDVLRNAWRRWDADRNGGIDAAEYRAFLQAESVLQDGIWWGTGSWDAGTRRAPGGSK